MRASHVAQANRQLTVRIRRVARIERDSLSNFVQALLLASPFLLLATDGATYAVGVVYVVAYGLLMLLPTALYILMVFDAARIMMKRRTVFVAHFLALYKVAQRTASTSPEPSITPVLRLGVSGNPLASLTGEMWILAGRMNRAGLVQLSEEAERLAKEITAQNGATVRLVAMESSVVSRAGNLDLIPC